VNIYRVTPWEQKEEEREREQLPRELSTDIFVFFFKKSVYECVCMYTGVGNKEGAEAVYV